MTLDRERLRELGKPFPADEIEWRIGRAGTKNNGDVWAKVLAYVTNRAIMGILDEICGPENWRNEFQEHGEGWLCGLSIRIGDEWITKWDGAPETGFESFKGGLSDAMKRAAVQWGIGRYLYGLDEGWAEVSMEARRGDGWRYQPKGKKTPQFWWRPPTLPAWALPEGHEPEQRDDAQQEESPAKPADPLPDDLDAALKVLEPYAGDQQAQKLGTDQARKFAAAIKAQGWSAEDAKQLLAQIGINKSTLLPMTTTPWGRLDKVIFKLCEKHDPAGDPPEDELDEYHTEDEMREIMPSRTPVEILRDARTIYEDEPDAKPMPAAETRLEAIAREGGWPEERWGDIVAFVTRGGVPMDCSSRLVEALEELFLLPYGDILSQVGGDLHGWEPEDRQQLEHLCRLMQIPTTSDGTESIPDAELKKELVTQLDYLMEPSEDLFEDTVVI